MSIPSSPGHIAFICAMPMEVRPLVKKLRLEKTEIGGVPVRSGRIGDRKVVAIVTGMGTQLAREGTERLLDAVDVDEAVVVGITRGDRERDPHRDSCPPRGGSEQRHGCRISPAPRAEGAPHGKMWTTDCLTTDSDEIAELRAKGVVSLDMETAGIAETCEARRIPWSVFRVFSDRATDESINEEVFHLSKQDGTPNMMAIACYFLKHPTHVARMAELAKGAKLASETAADAAIRAFSVT